MTCPVRVNRVTSRYSPWIRGIAGGIAEPSSNGETVPIGKNGGELLLVGTIGATTSLRSASQKWKNAPPMLNDDWVE